MIDATLFIVPDLILKEKMNADLENRENLSVNW